MKKLGFFFRLHTKVSACFSLKNVDIQTEKESWLFPKLFSCLALDMLMLEIRL